MIADATISEIKNQYRTRKITPRDLVSECYKTIRRLEPSLNAAITLIDESEALKKTEYVSNQKARLPLAGIPYVMKDAYLTRGIRTTAASKVLTTFIPPYSATVHKKLDEAGAILLGKMNMDAWGHGASTENTDFGPTKNPWDTTRSAGGSGGGPAAAVASRYCSFAIGEDTGGSIRNPAAWNNITALKVTYGRVSRYGAIAYASSLDTMGPTAKSVEDCAAVLNIIAGYDPYDATSSNRDVPDYNARLKKSIKGKKIALPKEYFASGLDEDDRKVLLNSLEIWESLGAEIKQISLPFVEYGVPIYYIIAPSETSSNLARYDGIRYGNGRQYFTTETKRRILVGTYALSAGYVDAFYKKAQKARTLLHDAYITTLKDVDAILAPVNPTPPPHFGELLNDPVKNMLADLYTGFINLIGLPSLALPCGFTPRGLPVGLQLIGKMFDEETLLNLGYMYQQETDWHKMKPQIIKETV